MKAKSKPISGAIDRIDDGFKFVRFVSRKMQDRTEYFFLQVFDSRNGQNGWGDKSAVLGGFGLMQDFAAFNMVSDLLRGRFVGVTCWRCSDAAGRLDL